MYQVLGIIMPQVVYVVDVAVSRVQWTKYWTLCCFQIRLDNHTHSDTWTYLHVCCIQKYNTADNEIYIN